MKKEMILLTGESGAGKSCALRHLEDLGFYCIDNVPSNLIPSVLRLIEDNPEIEKAVLAIDIRNPEFRENAPKILKELKEKYPDLEVWFFTASPQVLLRRFSETRRPHPLQRYYPEKSLNELIDEEKENLEAVKNYATLIIDTSHFNPHQLKQYIRGILGEKKPKVKVTFLSFGFKFGIPQDADNVFDVRFLPNPHFVENLREKDGTSKEVKEFLLKFEETRKLLETIKNFVKFSLPLYEKEGKAYITFAIGCTGGQHRSVAIAEIVAEDCLKNFPDYEIFVEHRERKLRKKLNKETVTDGD